MVTVKQLIKISALTGMLASCGSSEGVTDCVTTLQGTSACAETVGEDGSATVTTNATGSVSVDVVSFTYDDNGTADDADDTMVIVGADFDGNNTYSRDAGRDRNGFIAFRSDFQSQAQNYYATYGETPSGEIRVLVSATAENADEGDYIASFERLAASNVPAQGNANYEGSYAGAATVLGRGGGVALTEGDLVLYVEFDENSRVSGYISNRQITEVIAPEGGVAPAITDVQSTIILDEATLNDSNIWLGGTVATVDAAGDVTGEGTYVGVVGGPNGSEIGGYLEITEEVTINGEDGQIHEFGVYTGQCVDGTDLTCEP